MCGIIGFFNISGKKRTADYQAPIRKGMVSMSQRGPDGEGLFENEKVILGHKRLAIIDLHTGTQPMVDAESKNVIIFNGEIFNYKEIKQQLIALGHVFVTESDTETILHAYSRWGTGCLARLNGMFAFAIYDAKNKSLFLARDRLGIKPLFYSRGEDGLYFASSAAALRCFDEISGTMDMHAVSHYMTSIRTTMGPATMFRDIKSLLPGQFILADSRANMDPVQYWELPVLSKDMKSDISMDKAAAIAAGLLEESVQGQLMSDVPLGGFLSGGIDSSIIALLAGKMSQGHFGTYSTGYDAAGYNEWEFIRKIVAHFALKSTETHLDDRQFVDQWQLLTRFKGLPVSTPNEIAMRELALALQHDYKVALTGEGADEIFGGYTIPYFSAYDFDMAQRSAPLEHYTPTAHDRAVNRMYGRPYLMCRPDHYFLVNSWIPFRLKKRLLTSDYWNMLDGDAGVFSYYEGLFSKLEHCTTFDAYMHIHAMINLEGLLYRVDSSTMSASVEARVPFTDHRIAELLFSLPDNFKMDYKSEESRKTAQGLNSSEIDRQDLLSTKKLLRHAFGKAIPPEVLARKKMSFPVPFRELLAGPLKQMATDTLESSELMGTILQKDTIRQALETAETPQSSQILWPALNLCIWQHECSARLP